MDMTLEKIRKEVKRLMAIIEPNLPSEEVALRDSYSVGAYTALKQIEDYIDSLIVKPKFKVGDIVHIKGTDIVTRITRIDRGDYMFDDDKMFLSIEAQYKLELVKKG